MARSPRAHPVVPPPFPGRRRRGTALPVALSALVSVLLAGIAIAALRPHPALAPAATAPLQVGANAPRLDLTDALTGRPYAQAHGHGTATLVAFLSTQPDSADSVSRAQAVALTSLSAQYDSAGLRVVIVDDTPTAASTAALVNTAYDWHLGRVTLLADPGHGLAHRYGVTATPTAFLVDGSGTVLDRWNGQTPTAALSSAVTRALGAGSSS
jgi:peroxiredoxin